MDPLFKPFALKSLSLRNRIVMAPMTRMFSPQGIPTDAVVAYYGRRADGGAGLIITEGATIDRAAASYHPSVPGTGSDALRGWRKVVDSVRAAGSAIVLQLWHVGAQAHQDVLRSNAQALEAPSGLSLGGVPVCSVMTEEDIADVIEAYARSANMAIETGFDGIELHAAHGYLIDQFMYANTNRRLDRWGGSTLAERTRFAAEIVRAVRAAIGSHVALSIRISQWKVGHYQVRLATNPRELATWVEPLAEAGVDLFHCSQRRFSVAEFDGSDLNLAGWVRKLTGKATITVGCVGSAAEFLGDRSEESAPTLTELRRRLERGDFDLVAVGRAMLADPAWARKVEQGRLTEIKTDYDRNVLY